jgi:hypothetical protein
MVNRGDPALRVNTALTAAEVIDGEAVMINLGDGMYFTMDGVGAELWLLIEQGCSLAPIATCLAGRYEVEEPRVLADLGRVVDELVSAGLVVLDEGARDREPNVGDWDPPSAAYTAPALVSYSDMGDVLALDPPLPLLDPTPEP